MTRAELARLIDHSALKPEATDTEILAGADVVRRWGIGFYCVQPCHVALAVEALKDSGAAVVSVIGFPHGSDRSIIKAHAAQLAVREGAREVDMVMNVGLLKSGLGDLVARDIQEVVESVRGVPVKVILETCLLSDEEKIAACGLAKDSGAEFVKTSTGFHPAGGATAKDVRLLRQTVGADFGVKAAGGIRTLDDALAMLEAGANRLGTSASATILERCP